MRTLGPRMKKLKSIVGLWKGVYTFNSDEYFGVSVRFTMSLNINAGGLIGQSYDAVDDGGIPEPAKIEGTFDGQSISLIKQYPYLLYINEAGSFRKDVTKPSPDILLKGQIEDGCIKGDWEIIQNSFEQEAQILDNAATGKWEMRKEKLLLWF